MRIALGCLLLLVGLSYTNAASRLSTEIGDFGETYQFSTRDAQFLVTNHAAEPVEVAVMAQRATDVVVAAPRTIPAHGSVPVRVRIDSGNDIGVKIHSFEVQVLGHPDETVYGVVRGFVQSILDEPRPHVDFGVIDVNADSSAIRTVSLQSEDDPELRITRVLDKPDFTVVKVAPDGKSLDIVLNRGVAVWGLQSGYVKLAISNPKQTEAWVEVLADIHGAVVPFTNPFNFGVARLGENNEFAIRLDHRDDKDFKVGGIALKGFKGTPTITSCAPPRAGCKLLKITLAPTERIGKIDGKILVDLPEYARQLSITVSGLVFKKSGEVVDFDTAAKKANEESAHSTIASALKAATQSEETATPIVMPTPPGEGPLLKWTVQNESQVYGYLIYRADSETGHAKRLNEGVVRSVQTRDGRTVTYQWRDTTAQPGQTYWYEVRTIDLRGVRQPLTGRVKKTS